MASDNDSRAREATGDRFGRVADAVRLGLAFLTRLPTAHPRAAPGDLAAAAWAFPAIGGVLGLLAGIVFGGAVWADVPVAAAALLALATLAWLTGALHEDGLADTVDGLGGGATPGRKLEIMRDSRVGAFGVIALVVAIGLKVAALSALGTGSGTGAAIAGLIAAAAVSRAAMAPVMLLLAPARTEGLGAAAGKPTPRTVALALAIGLFLAAGMLITHGAMAFAIPVACGLIAAGVVGMIARRQIGGYTGDVMGAVQQTAETAILVALSAVLA